MFRMQTGKYTRIIVQRSEFEGKKGIDVRKWFLSKDSDEFKPTRKGIWLSLDAAEFVAESITALLD